MKKLCKIIALLLVAGRVGACSDSNPEQVSFSWQGISFNHPGDWKTETEELVEGENYYLCCEKRGNHADLIVVTFVNDTTGELNDYIDEYLENLADNDNVKSFKSEEPRESRFGNYAATCVDYSFNISGEMCHGCVYAFENGGRTFRIVKQSDSIKLLESNFAMIEETFDIGSAPLPAE